MAVCTLGPLFLQPNSGYIFVSTNSLIADRLAICTGHPMTPISFETYVTMNEIAIIIIQAIMSHDLAQDANTAVASFIQLVFLLRLLEEAVKDLALLELVWLFGWRTLEYNLNSLLGITRVHLSFLVRFLSMHFFIPKLSWLVFLWIMLDLR